MNYAEEFSADCLALVVMPTHGVQPACVPETAGSDSLKAGLRSSAFGRIPSPQKLFLVGYLDHESGTSIVITCPRTRLPALASKSRIKHS